jgi:hypothetical protein
VARVCQADELHLGLQASTPGARLGVALVLERLRPASGAVGPQSAPALPAAGSANAVRGWWHADSVPGPGRSSMANADDAPKLPEPLAALFADGGSGRALPITLPAGRLIWPDPSTALA